MEDFAPLILGRSVDKTRQFEADIISGAFDADKLDYFPRDGRAAGIEMALDIDRLLHCLEIVELEKDGAPMRSIVVSIGGFNAIQQLLFARATLFASVYHHHKVRACDCMVKACYERFVDSNQPFKKTAAFPGVNLTSAADFLFLTDADYFNEAVNHPPESEEHQLIHDLLYRRLFKRVLTISTYTLEQFDSDDEQKANYRAFYNLRKNPKGLRELAKALHGNAEVTCSASRVWFDIPGNPSFDKPGQSQINVAPRHAKPKLKRLSEFIPVEQWVKTYQQYYSRSYVFGPPDVETRKKLAKSGIELLKERFGLRLNADAVSDDLR